MRLARRTVFGAAWRAIARAWAGDTAATAVEYAIMLASIAVVILVALSSLGVGITGVFANLVRIFASGHA